MPETDQDALTARALRPARMVVPVLGAGVSQGAELPGVAALGDRLLQVGEFASSPRWPGSALLDIVDNLTATWRTANLANEVVRMLSGEPRTDDPMALELVRVPSRFIVTLNYDALIERTALAAGLSAPTVLTNAAEDLIEAHRLLVHGPCPPDRLTILHLHGSLDAPETIVLGSESYQRLVRDPNVEAVLQELALHRTMLFYGTTLNETHVLAELQRQINKRDHVLVCRAADLDDVSGGRLSVSYARHGIRISTVADFPDLPGHVARLSLIPDTPNIGGAQTTGVLPPAEPYVRNDFSDRRRPVSQHDQVLAMLEHDGYEMPNVLTEEDVAAGHRTLVVGGVGTGKSDLLAHIAHQSRSTRPAVLIRLAEQRFTGGQPERVLGRWARTGMSANGDVSVSDEAIDGGSMHFLLDGLDEVPAAQQVDAARLILDLAERLPQHAFTVTSRNVAAASILADAVVGDRPSWEVFDLEPGSEWQSRYLAFRGVGLDALLGEMPELADAIDLLRTPFFLSRVIDLRQQGRLAGLKDVGELLAALIDSQLEREDPLVSLDPLDVRTWLQDVALAGLLAGRRSLTVVELMRFPLPEGATGSADQLAEMLVQRLLFAENAGVYRFAHRILGEQLAAEAITRRPASDAILDCLAPQRTATISGVREDALLTVTLASLRSAAWRRAFAARDPLAAAVATPNDASDAERLRAAELIWERYTRRAIWMWQRGLSQLLDHASALGRLVATIPDSEFSRTVRTAIHSGTREQQGNAVRVYSRVNPKGLVDDLRVVLDDPDRDGVVHRQAALAAEDGGFTELVDPLADLFASSPDHSVRQTAGSALIKLLPADRRLEVGLRLMATEDADLMLAMLQPTAADEELVLLAAAYDGGDSSWDTRTKKAITQAIDRLTTPVPEVVTAACKATVFWHLDAEPSARLAREAPTAAARGIADAVRAGTGWWYAVRLATHLSPEELRAAGLDEEFIERAEASRASRELTTALAEPAAPPLGDEPPTRGARAADLSHLLGGKPAETDATLLRDHRTLAGHVKDLNEDERARLMARIAGWWPDKPFSETITRIDRHSWRQEYGPAAWVSYASALELPVGAEPWAQIASSGVVFEPERSWLRSGTSDLAQTRAAELLAGCDDPERWLSLFGCCAGRLTEPLLRAAAEALAGDASSADESEEERGARGRVIAALVSHDQVALARTLAHARPELEHVLTRSLAENGDACAQLRLAEELIGRAERSELLQDENLSWLNQVSDDRLLKPLFRLLGMVWKTTSEPTPRVSTGRGLHDVTHPVMRAIASVGGQRAVEGYDELLARGGDLRWLRSQRDEVAATLLRTDGVLEAAAAAAADASVPALESVAEAIGSPA